MTKSMITILRAVVAAMSLTLVDSALGQVLKQEPALGSLRDGQSVMVDDGSCPKGQIKLVTGGNHKKAGGTKDIIRSHACIAKPN